jgi:alpha-L-rhamnosidase
LVLKRLTENIHSWKDHTSAGFAPLAAYDSFDGPISSTWKRTGEQFQLDVTIPADTSASVYVPARGRGPATEGGEAAVRFPGMEFVRMERGRTVFRVPSGNYKFVSRTS